MLASRLRTASRPAMRPPARGLKMSITKAPPGFREVILIESGVGTDQHGQDLTKACVRACKDAISFNSVPSLERLVPGGAGNAILRLQLAVPFDSSADGLPTPPAIDMAEVQACFAYGKLLPVEILQGGARFESMCSVPSLGDSAEDSSWVYAIACVTVGY